MRVDFYSDDENGVFVGLRFTGEGEQSNNLYSVRLAASIVDVKNYLTLGKFLYNEKQYTIEELVKLSANQTYEGLRPTVKKTYGPFLEAIKREVAKTSGKEEMLKEFMKYKVNEHLDAIEGMKIMLEKTEALCLECVAITGRIEKEPTEEVKP